MLTIHSLTVGRCTWCLEETEVVQAQFQDGLRGSFCKKHLWQALKVRCEAQQTGNPKDVAPNKSSAGGSPVRPGSELEP